jgi:undecaprenyl-diphosphatase
MPQSPCLSFPQELIEWDRKLQAQIDQGEYKYEPGLNTVRWYTEDPLGITLMLIAWALLFALCFRFPPLRLKKFLLSAAFLTLSLGLSDLLSSALKSYFGRLKPHVSNYNEGAIPALSFPSNHAFNTSVFFVLALYLLASFAQRFKLSRAVFFAFLSFWVVYIGYTRVLLGQHYPLDVVSGYVFGTVYGLIVLKVLVAFRGSKFWRHRLP